MYFLYTYTLASRLGHHTHVLISWAAFRAIIILKFCNLLWTLSWKLFPVSTTAALSYFKVCAHCFMHVYNSSHKTATNHRNSNEMHAEIGMEGGGTEARKAGHTHSHAHTLGCTHTALTWGGSGSHNPLSGQCKIQAGRGTPVCPDKWSQATTSSVDRGQSLGYNHMRTDSFCPLQPSWTCPSS